MELQYIKVNPSENITVLVRTPVPRSCQSAAANQIMAAVGGEQVGFIEPASQPGAAARLQMMGGEFCGNATMSLAAVLAQRDGLENAEYALEVSGCEGLVPCRIEKKADGLFGTVSMPLPQKVSPGKPYPLVTFPGIVHQIVPAADFPDPDRAAQYACRRCQELNVPAFGLLLWSGTESFMRPCVYVAATGSAVWERGCASGSAALGVWFTRTDGSPCHSISQPGGTISVRCGTEGSTVRSLTVTGSVKLMEQGTVSLTE